MWCFLVSLSDNSLLVYKNAIISEYWLCIPPLCQIQLFGQLVFWWRLYGFLYTLSCHLQMIVFLPPFQFGCLLFLFLAWSLCPGFSILCMLNRSGESKYPCLVPELSGKAFSFCPLSMMSAVGLLHMAFITWGMLPVFPLSFVFLS